MANGIKDIAELVADRSFHTDEEILAELKELVPLADESEACWSDEDYWNTANLYLALANIAAARKLRPAIELLLERACYGDPNTIMRGLRHNLEAIVNPEWSYLTEVCLAATKSSRLGTRLWAIDELVLLQDPRAKSIFEEAVKNGPELLRWKGQNGLDRLSQM
jgi:hypothetical protein